MPSGSGAPTARPTCSPGTVVVCACAIVEAMPTVSATVPAASQFFIIFSFLPKVSRHPSRIRHFPAGLLAYRGCRLRTCRAPPRSLPVSTSATILQRPAERQWNARRNGKTGRTVAQKPHFCGDATLSTGATRGRRFGKISLNGQAVVPPRSRENPANPAQAAGRREDRVSGPEPPPGKGRAGPGRGSGSPESGSAAGARSGLGAPGRAEFAAPLPEDGDALDYS